MTRKKTMPPKRSREHQYQHQHQHRQRQRQRQRRRRRERFWAWLRLALGPSLALLLGVGLLIGLNSERGRDLIASAINTGTAGRVRISGLGGSLPFAPRLASLELADADGCWLRIEQAQLELNPTALLVATLEIRALTATAVDLRRLPSGNTGSNGEWSPPLALKLQRLEIDRLRLNGLIAAAPILSIQGSAVLSRQGSLETTLAIRPLDPSDLRGLATVNLRFERRPATSEASLALDGDWAGQPITVQMQLRRDQDKTLELSLGDSHWSGIGASGQLRWPSQDPLPFGDIRLQVAKLDALNPLLAPWLPISAPVALSGRLNVELISDPNGLLIAEFEGEGLQLLQQVRLGRLALRTEIEDVLEQPRIHSALKLVELSSPGVDADLNAEVSGPITNLLLDTEARLRLKPLSGDAKLQLSATGELKPFDRLLRLSAASLEFIRRRPDAPDQVAPDQVAPDQVAPDQSTPQREGLRDNGSALGSARARTPAVTANGLGVQLIESGSIDFSDGLNIDTLTFALSAPTASGWPGTSGRVRLSGRLAPALALDARAIDIPLATLIDLLPGSAALPEPVRGFNGLIDLETRLEGEHSAPSGRLDLLAREIRSENGAAVGLPSGELRIALRVGSQATTIEASALAGRHAHLDLRGQIDGSPFTTLGTLSLHTRGRLDAGLFNPQLAASGRTLEGQLALDLGLGGRLNKPRLEGVVRFSEGAWKDQLSGLVLTQIDGEMALSGDSLRLTRLSARADPGTIELSGSLGWQAPRQPIDLSLIARQASPVRRDALKLQADADLRLSGELAGDMRLEGGLRFDQIALRIPERFPATVATLEVKEIGPRRQARRDPRPRSGIELGSPARVALDLRIDAPRAITLTGRGVDAELGGEINARGTLANPAIIGDFRLLRGEYALLGQPLRFSHGRIGFDGASMLDPTLDLEARVTAEGATAILSVEGSARRPRIRLSGEPQMPEDEVLARLLFGLSRSRLSALQIARLGLAATSLAGIDNPALGLLERTRSGLGLDRFRLDHGAEGHGRGDAILEGGRYLSERVYLGARQGTRVGDTQGILRMQVGPRIRLETDVGANSGARAGAAFEFEY
ncbi:translocation/assembly module TamB domain-containing protein [Halochromatium roseum]|uniref:translocation/assembly module TamB domain-containing protein n=1 Tax=Halochromatium roseum TaxID=391920 RepID=UPI001F5C8F8A|nr:translocation/assembly module TamB domain-containing protein [Halochromatium roseum]